MTLPARSGPRRGWHPVPVGAGLLLACLAVGAGALAGIPGLPLTAWLLAGVTAGFATSGST